MGDNAVYKKQFYTKLVSSCHFLFLYLYVQYAAFLSALLKTHESKSSSSMPVHTQSDSELADAVLILFPGRHVVSLLLSERGLGHRMIKGHARRAGSQPEAGRICGGQIFSQMMTLNGDKVLNVPH